MIDEEVGLGSSVGLFMAGGTAEEAIPLFGAIILGFTICDVTARRHTTKITKTEITTTCEFDLN